MYSVKQPSEIIFGENSLKNYKFPENCLLISSKGAKKRGWLDLDFVKNYQIFDNVESNPSIETVQDILREFENSNFSHVIGLGGGSVMDVAKFVGLKLNKKKITIPTIFGSGSEVTRISVLKVAKKKQSFHDDKIFADVAIIDPTFMKSTPKKIINDAIVDSCAQSTEAYDSKNSNMYTKFLCKAGFDNIEKGLMESNNEKIIFGTLLTGLGFGNASTTLGHALSYVFSNEGFSHGHALAFTTQAAHKFNNSMFFDRFKKIVDDLKFEKISLKSDFDNAAEVVLQDKRHLDNNPKKIMKEDIINMLKLITKD
jgi:succinate semialdehyde reductase|tara:strand:+ start:1467 stop:2402 length:936 start_codon:yes stop_codon:yes gene_type:complete